MDLLIIKMGEKPQTYLDTRTWSKQSKGKATMIIFLRIWHDTHAHSHINVLHHNGAHENGLCDHMSWYNPSWGMGVDNIFHGKHAYHDPHNQFGQHTDFGNMEENKVVGVP